MFGEHGYRGASVDEVVARAGVTKGALYWNFQGKEDLFRVLLDERIDARLREVLERAEAAPGDEALAGLLTDLLDADRTLLLLSHERWSLAVRDPAQRAPFVERQRALRAAVARAVRARRRATGAPKGALPADRVAAALLALLAGLAMERAVDKARAPKSLVTQVLDRLDGKDTD